MIKLIDKNHKRQLLNIVFEKTEQSENWVVSEHRYYNQYVYDDDICFISIIYSNIYNKIEFFNKIKNKYGVYTISYFNKYKLKRKLNSLLKSKRGENIDEILNLNYNLKSQEAENGNKE